MPGDPVLAVMSKFQGQMSTQAIHSLYVLFGLDKNESMWGQYVDYWKNLLHGDLGLSFLYFPTPVSEILRSSLPWTIALVGVTTVLSFLIGTSLGMFAGWRRGGSVDGILPATTFLSSIPYFWLGLVVIFALTGPGTFFPSSGGFTPGIIPGWSWSFVNTALLHSLLPALTILVTSMSGWILSMRNMMVTVAAEDYITVAHAKGPSERRVMMSYAARNARCRIVSFALRSGCMWGAPRRVCSRSPGIGHVCSGRRLQRLPLLQGIFLVITLRCSREPARRRGLPAARSRTARG
jgi:peptide/nickel transport system permease protein